MIDISEEYKKMLRELRASTHPEREEGEFTIAEYAEANGLTVTKAGAELLYLYDSGKIHKPPKRYIGSHMTVVYKYIQPH